MKRIDGAARPQLEVRDLTLVLALAEAGSTATASATLHLTQSAISRALSQAEDRLGVRLFERRSRGIIPTLAGRRLIEGAPQLLRQLEELERHLAEEAELPRRISVVCECYTAYRWLPSALLHLHARNPGLIVDIAPEHSGRAVRALASNKVDVALLTTAAVPGSSKLVVAPLFSDEIVFVVGSAHPLFGARALTPANLRADVLITGQTPEPEARWFMRSVFGRRPPTLRRLRFPLTEAVMDAARAGLGIAAVSEWMATSYLGSGDLRAKRLVTGPLERPWRMAYRSDMKEPADLLATALRSSRPRLA
jgi:LysR family transcriptional regulator for metE and metH